MRTIRGAHSQQEVRLSMWTFLLVVRFNGLLYACETHKKGAAMILIFSRCKHIY